MRWVHIGCIFIVLFFYRVNSLNPLRFSISALIGRYSSRSGRLFVFGIAVFFVIFFVLVVTFLEHQAILKEVKKFLSFFLDSTYYSYYRRQRPMSIVWRTKFIELPWQLTFKMTNCTMGSLLTVVPVAQGICAFVSIVMQRALMQGSRVQLATAFRWYERSAQNTANERPLFNSCHQENSTRWID